MKKLEETPWSSSLKTKVDHINLLRHTMVPEVAYRLIQEDIKVFYGNDCAFDDAIVEEMIMVAAHNNYKLVHVKFDDDE